MHHSKRLSETIHSFCLCSICDYVGRRKAVEQLEKTTGVLKSEADILEEEIELLLAHASR